MGEPIRFFNRQTQRIEEEAVYGERFLRWAYETTAGRAALHAFVKRPFFSKWYGWRMSSPASRSKIAPFIRQYGLEPGEFLDSPGEFTSFNEFFARRLRDEARPIHPDEKTAVLPADARHLCLPDVNAADHFFVKGQRFDLAALLGGDSRLASRFQHGSLLFSRLCPVDYHRFHFPLDGTPSTPRLLNGPLFSVSPLALRRNLAYLWHNKRVLTLHETQAAGTIAILEIGATCVGSIHQTHTPDTPAAKGSEKGYFAFGGSCVITLFEKGAITFADDLVEHSAAARETLAHMGTPMGRLP